MDCTIFMYSSCTSAMYYTYVSHKIDVWTLGVYSALASIAMFGYWGNRLSDNLTEKMEFWQKNATFLLSVLFCNKYFVILSKDTASCRFIDIQNSEAKCFILTKREPENSLSVVTDMIVKVGNVVQLFPRYIARTSVVFHLQGFLRTSVAEYRHEVCAF